MSETASEIGVLRAALAAAEARTSAAEGALLGAKGELTQVQAIISASDDMIRREQYGHSAERHARMSKHNPVAKAINYMFEADGRWEAFNQFLDDGRICLTNNAAERALRGIALGRKAWLFAGSPRGRDRAAFMYSLIVTAKMNNIDPQAWLADVLARLPDMPLSTLPEPLPWNWKRGLITKAA